MAILPNIEEWIYQVSQLVAQLFQMRVRMKNLMGVMQSGSLPTLSNLEEALKAEEKVISFSIYMRLKKNFKLLYLVFELTELVCVK